MSDWSSQINPSDPQPSDSYLEYLKGRTEMDAAHLEEAIMHFRKSFRIEPHFKTGELLGECLLKLGNPEQAVEVLEKSVRISRAARPAFLLAEAHRKIGDLDAAKNAIEESLRCNPTYGPALELRKQLD